MNKKLFLCAALAACMLSSCTGGQQNPQSGTSASPTAAVTAEPSAAPKTLLQADTVSRVQEGWTEISKYRYDIDGDGERETLRLCTDAKRGANGEVLWDDSHNWVLEMTDASNIFTLYNGRISNGIPYFEVYEDKDAKICVGLTVSSGAGYEIKKYVYIKDKKAFETEDVYTENGINRLYTSIQEY